MIVAYKLHSKRFNSKTKDGLYVVETRRLKMMNGRVGGLGLLFVLIYSCSDNISCSPRWPQIHSVAGPGLTDTPDPPAPYTQLVPGL